MPENDDQEYAKGDESKPICPRCGNTGFYRGKVCICIGAKDKGDIDYLMEMLGMKK